MKKFLAILLLLSMLCMSFVACTGGEGEETTPDTTTPPAEEAATLADAVEYLNSMYKSDEGKKTPADYLLIAQVPIGDVKFEITWTVDLEGIEIVPENGTYTVKLPSKNETETAYTLTATVKDAAGASETKTFGRVLPVYDNSAAVTDPQEGESYKLFLVQANVGKTLFLTTKTQNNENKFILSTATPADGAEFMVEKADGGVKIYTMVDGVKTYVYAHTTTAADGKISKYVGYSTENSSVFTYQANVNAWFTKCDGVDYVFGTYSSYETACISESSYITPENTGLTQFVVAFMNKEAADEFVPEEAPKDPTELTSIKDASAIGEKLEHNTNTVEKYLVKGEITEIKSEQYGNMYIKDAEGNTLYIYGLYSKDGTVRYDAMTDKPQVGDTITVMSQICNYNGPQLKNATLQKLEKAGATAPVAQKPEVGTAYKFVFTHDTLGKTLYITGAMDGYYMATTEDKSAGCDVYVEETTGGYYFYCMVGGTKTYINMVQSGTYTNAKYEAAPSTVYTYDETLKTLVGTVEGKTFIFGTRSDKTYTTIGPMSTDTACFYAIIVK